MADTTTPLRSSQTAHSYYASFPDHLDLANKFLNIDEEVGFNHCLQQLQQAKTRNFVLDFGNDDAWCAVNLEHDDFAALLSKPKPKCFGTRWINIWVQEEQKDSIRTITSPFGISERLQAMMCTDPVKQRQKEPSHSPKEPISRYHSRNSERSRPPKTTDDLEGGYDLRELSNPDMLAGDTAWKHLTFAQITNQIWHFCSVDYGSKYTCIGYNSLYTVPGPAHNGNGLPDGQRLWSWVILCDDGTVISIQENPFPEIEDNKLPEADTQQAVLNIVRRNVRLIFSGVSRLDRTTSESASLVTIRVRPFSDDGPDQAGIKQDDGPSLLFYYIFDDWVSSYGLIAKREHKYDTWLDELRANMLKRPDVDLVDELHWLGRRLAVLKRLYQSYDLIMTRILQRQRLLRDEARSNHKSLHTVNTLSESNFTEVNESLTQSQLGAANTYDSPAGVTLGSAAIGRFERLVDRINLYCLCEIDACLTEKESLTFLNFNLIALKDSQAVEKLTRITILLAKATILFLPVSLMTAYFSTQIDDLQGVYTKNDYWVAFGVIMFLSIALLVIFGLASDTVEGKTIYRSLVRTFFRSSRERLLAQRQAQFKQR
ncbi:hypothetical protein ASPZODRAFT_58856 [Penicilliopsis zonata CBS 506.65]|uniref:ADP-ribosylation factor n=1 Tax=Penicilliopsis zonata CBS 506.65 TaxID=1073090 RepID=A0A1L9SRP4_9EURO|nr:hypothetical protein ASPZODRAFT_58856 [Penicilliopsis zonata CBS 506.65]OJJ49786.1 hypothetical protein ASPZODRAFT_58856 [Penicilliopsis zonata CBS 506.65]